MHLVQIDVLKPEALQTPLHGPFDMMPVDRGEPRADGRSEPARGGASDFRGYDQGIPILASEPLTENSFCFSDRVGSWRHRIHFRCIEEIDSFPIRLVEYTKGLLLIAPTAEAHGTHTDRAYPEPTLANVSKVHVFPRRV